MSFYVSCSLTSASHLSTSLLLVTKLQRTPLPTVPFSFHVSWNSIIIHFSNTLANTLNSLAHFLHCYLPDKTLNSDVPLSGPTSLQLNVGREKHKNNDLSDFKFMIKNLNAGTLSGAQKFIPISLSYSLFCFPLSIRYDFFLLSTLSHSHSHR